MIVSLFMAVTAFAQNEKVVSTYGKHEKPTDYVKITSGTISLGVGTSYNFYGEYSVPFLSGISAKYFFDESWAIRANLQFGRKFTKSFSSENSNFGMEDIPTNQTEISNTDRTSNFMLNLGFEHRHKLSNRFFGYYGTDIAIGGTGTISRQKENGKLIFEEKTERACNLGILPFIGVEFFIGPRISIATEFGYNIAFKFNSKDVYKTTSVTEKDFPYSSIESNIDFGNSMSAGLRFAYYF